MLATSALSLQELSDGRFLLGIGTSGPRVMEGWHGVAFSKPVTRTRETIEIIRIISRGEPLGYDGEVFEVGRGGHGLDPERLLVLVGLGEASYATISPSLISDSYAPAKRNNALTIFYVAIPVGAARPGRATRAARASGALGATRTLGAAGARDSGRREEEGASAVLL